MRRRSLVAAVLGGTVLAASAGWLAGTRIKSPGQIAAQTAAPVPSLISVPIERKTLSTDVVVRGTVRHGTPQAVVLAASPLKTANAIVTSPAQVGGTLVEGTVAMSVSGRPVFALQGAQPSYRDLSIDAKGPDVVQLEQALERLHLQPGRVDGVFDARTAEAMAALYQTAGWEPFGLTDAQRQELRAAHEAAATADDRRVQAQVALEAATRGPAPADLSQAEGDIVAARDAEAAAGAAIATAAATQQTAHQAVATATTADAAARAVGRRDDLLAQADLTTRTSAVQTAVDDERTAELRLAEAAAVDPETGQPKTSAAELEALRAGVIAAQAAIVVARADVAAAQAALDAAPAETRAATDKTAADLDQARRDATQADVDAERAPQALASAQSRVADAQARLDRLIQPVGAGALTESVSVATREARRTSAELSRLVRASNFQVPADELLFLPSLPVRVDSVTVPRGEVLSAEAMVVSGFRLAVDSALSLTDATLVKRDAPVTIDEPELGITVQGKVTAVGDRPGTNGTDPQHVYLEVTPDEAPDQLLGASVKLTIAVRSTGGDVLAVPVSALSVAAGGTSRVQVVTGRRTRFVAVRPGLAADGLVQVTPVGSRLATGDRVVVGDARNHAPAAGKTAARGP